MSKSINAKQAELNKRMGNNKPRNKNKGQSGTHRLKQLNHESKTIEDKTDAQPQKSGLLSRLFKK